MMIQFPRIIAHKSYSKGFVGNTYEAVEVAVKKGIKAIEIDIRRTKDTVTIIFHDEALNPSTNFSGLTRSYTADEIIKAQYTHPKDGTQTDYAVTLLEPVLRDFGKDLLIFLEIKESALPLIRNVIDLVRHYKLEKNVIIESFSVDCLYKSRHLAPDLPIMLAYTYDATPITYEETAGDEGEGSWLWTQKWFQKFMRSQLKPDYYAPRFTVEKEEIKDLIDQGEKVIVWTVDDKKIATDLLALGVAAVMTNVYEDFKDL
jgi:glycerophosphoryl diester phosphodiesterase